MAKNFRKILPTFSLVLVLISIDQLMKYIIRLRGGFYICNPGITFGIELPYWIIFSIYIVFLALFSYLIFGSKIRYNSLSLSLVLAGALSNLADRLAFGCVIDYIDIRVWPVFNLADMMIVLGIAIFILLNWNKSRCESTN